MGWSEGDQHQKQGLLKRESLPKLISPGGMVCCRNLKLDLF